MFNMLFNVLFKQTVQQTVLIICSLGINIAAGNLQGGLSGWNAAMHAEDGLVDGSRKWKAIEHLVHFLPNHISISSKTNPTLPQIHSQIKNTFQYSKRTFQNKYSKIK